ncbi:sulfotransferase [Actibacterium sp. MT2.3-13A]|uniref:sulfotransferase n=1 Tax=Actibacterium sp. MT2.3-13A TaxID=2828332 RepID=UPI001BAD0213|nr:sulfotransferase [Actibacterium sp. MT2.3-13A]
MAELKVVNLGLPKSGTTTLGEALRRAGLRVADWRIRAGQSADNRLNRAFVGKLMYQGYFETGDPLSLMPEFDAFTEIDIVRQGLNLWPQTDWGLIAAIRAHHPGARFILTHRDPAKLSDSMGRWSNLGKTRLPGNAIPGLPQGYGATDAERIRWIEGHYAFCRRVFEGAADFLEYDVADAEAPARIGDFLGIALPWWGVANANANRPAEGGDC